MQLHKDLGYDEVNEDWYGLYILKEDGTIFCQVYGKTTEECDKNAKRVLKTNKHKL